MNIKTRIFRELKLFCENYFKNRDYFSLVYGSYASDDFTEKSDLDFFIATNKHDAADFIKTRDFIVDLHNSNGLKINEEVP